MDGTGSGLRQRTDPVFLLSFLFSPLKSFREREKRLSSFHGSRRNHFNLRTLISFMRRRLVCMFYLSPLLEVFDQRDPFESFFVETVSGMNCSKESCIELYKPMDSFFPLFFFKLNLFLPF